MTEPTAGARAPWTRRDLAVVGVLIATALVIGAPILDGGWLTYFDNAPHVAEIYALAGDGADGWSEIGFAGISLDALHSPVVWRGLAALHGLGVDIGPIYAVVVCLALAAPALALYAVARSRLPWAWAATLAYVLLIQRSAIVGTAAATGGMFMFYYATAALVVLADRLARPTATTRDTAAIAALLGCIGLTHLFVLVAAVVLITVHVAWTLVARRARAGAAPVRVRAIVRRDAIAAAIGAVAAIAYWLPVFISADRSFQPPQNLGIGDLARLLILPTDRISIETGLPSAATLPFGLEVVPQAALVLAGVVGAARIRRRDADPLPAYGLGLAAVVIAMLVVVRIGDLSALGPVSWRFVYFIRVGCALAAIPVCAWGVARWRARRPAAAAGAAPRRRRVVLATVAGAAAIASGLVWGAGLRRDVLDDDGPELAEVRALWAWLRGARTDDWGRIYVQDTFMAPPAGDGLARSHVLALTLAETGLATIGPYYGVVPAATARWTVSEFGGLFGRPTVFRRGPDDRVAIDLPLVAFGVSHIVTATTASAAELERAGLAPIHRVGRFTVFRHDQPQTVPVGVPEGRFLVFRLAGEAAGEAVLAHAHHPFWRVATGPPGARVARGSRGRMAIAGLPAGEYVVALEYRPPRLWPVSLAGWLGILTLALLGDRRWRRAPW